MEPKKHTIRRAVTGGEPLKVRDINNTNLEFDDFFEDGMESFLNDDVIKVQEQRIEALKRAIDIAKLMSNVTVNDVIDIASKILEYLNNSEV